MKRDIITVICILVCFVSFGQDISKEYSELKKTGDSLSRVGDYKNSAIVRSLMLNVYGWRSTIADRYSTACSWSLANYPDSAFYQLNIIANSTAITFSDFDDIVNDEDFNPILNDNRWQDVKNKMFKNAYRTFLNTQINAGLKIATPFNETPKWLLSNSIDSAFAHLNDAGYLLFKQKKYDQAYPYFKVSLNSYPRSYILNRDMGDYYKAINDKARAFVYYLRGMNLKYWQDIFKPEGLLKIDSAIAAGYQQLSEQIGRKAMPTDFLLATAANRLLQKAMFDKAFIINKMNLEYHPNSYRAYKGMSDYYKKTGDTEKTKKYNTKSLLLQYKLPEDFFQPLFNVEEYFISRYENISMQKSFKVLTPELMINTLGNYFLELKMFEKAEFLFKMNVTNFPQSQNVYKGMSGFYKARNDKAKEEEFDNLAQLIKNRTGGQNFPGNMPVPDTSFNVAVQNPVCINKCQTILFDEAHNNYHTAAGRYKPFANLIANDGFKVLRGTMPFTIQSLEHINVVVIASTGIINQIEIKVLNKWIHGGGSLLVITDHDNPTSNDLLQSIGIQTPDINYTADTLHGTFAIRFTKKEMLLGNHPIINGRNNSEKIEVVNSFTGRTIIGPVGCSVLLPLSPSAVDYMTIEPFLRMIEDMIPVQSMGLRSHGVAFTLGKGKVVALSEAAMLTAQIFPDGQPVGMNLSGSDNRQFALNIVRWLTDYLK